MKRKAILAACAAANNYFGIKYALDHLDVRALLLQDDADAHETLARNLNVLHRSAPLTMPVAWGSASPVLESEYTWDSYRAVALDKDGEQESGESADGPCVVEDHAWDLLYRTAKSEGKITLVTLCPLTDLAIALFKYEDLPDYLEQVIIMGGTTDMGNVGPYSEANFAEDPYAAQAVMNSGIPVVTVGLNVARDGALSSEDQEKFFSGEDARRVAELIRENRQLHPYVNWLVVHDVLTVAAAESPEILQTKRYATSVEYKSRLCWGRQVIDVRKHCDTPENCEVAVGVNRPDFIKMLASGGR